MSPADGKRSARLEVLSNGPEKQLEIPAVISSLSTSDDFDPPFEMNVEVGKGDQTAEVKALIDSGCGIVSVIDTELAHQLEEKLSTCLVFKLHHPRPIQDFQRQRVKDPMTHKLVLPITIAGHFDPAIPLYITDLGAPTMIIGRPWLRRHRAVLDFDKETLTFKKGCEHIGRDIAITASSICRPKQSLVLKSTDPTVSCDTKSVADGCLPSTDSSQSREIGESFDSVDIEKDCLQRAEKNRQKAKERRRRQYIKEAQINSISAPAFALLARQEGHEIFAVSMQDIRDEQAKREAATRAQSELDLLLPEHLHPYKDVFEKEAANTLPPHRKWDHKIQLTDDAVLPKTQPLRRLSEDELVALKGYLEENLTKGWISPSHAEFASPILFVKKPNGGIRFCVDYRALNGLTKKNRYPLPLVDETIARVAKAKIFTKLDIISAFHRLRMAEEKDEDLTTFNTRFGTFKYHVMPFGLCNGPSSFQQFMNDHFMDMSDFVSVYVDDLLIFSNNNKEHKAHVEQVLQKLREMGLTVDILKSEFDSQSVRYLGVILTSTGIRMDPAKVAVIKEWPKPRSGADTRAIRQFLGFANYYRRFIRGFSKIAKPLNELLHINSVKLWTDACDKAFEALKDAVLSQPVLQHFRPERVTIVECDASDVAVGGILSQIDPADDELKPVAFFSTTHSPAERNYAIYDKEMLAIIRCFEEWRPELLGTQHEDIRVLTDHKALEYFMTTKQLTRRQARWAEFLSEYQFKIAYRPGAANGKADMLTRQPIEGELSRASNDPHLQQTLLPAECLSPEVRQDVGIARLEAEVLEEEEVEDEELPLFERVRITAEPRYLHGRLIVPQSMITQVIKQIHCCLEAGHPGIRKTCDLISRAGYSVPTSCIKRFIGNCHMCQRMKPKKQKPMGLLKPLSISELTMPWRHITMDFVTGLPVSQEGNDCILVVVDRLSKERHFIACKKTVGSEETAKLLCNFVWKYHGLPDTIITDRGTQFNSALWKELCKILGITAKMSTAFHPQTDGQTEVVNGEMERYLRTYVDYQQTNWEALLPMAEFASNSMTSESTGTSPFFVTKGYHPRMSFDCNIDKGAASGDDGQDERKKALVARAGEIGAYMDSLWTEARRCLERAQQQMKQQADKKRRECDIKVGDKVWLSMKNLQQERPSRKLSPRFEGPFEVVAEYSGSFKLQLPSTMKCHPVFHASLLYKHADDALPGQEVNYDHPGPVVVQSDAAEDEWEVEAILDAKIRRRRLDMKAKWVGWPDDATWYPASNFKSAPAVVQAFYDRYPTKPRPAWLTVAIEGNSRV